MKKFTVLVFLMAFLIGTASCGSRADSNPSQSIPDLSGQWKQVNSDSQNRYQGAIIDGNTIEIYWVVNNGDTYSLYWSGSFVAPTTADELYSWVSDNNKEKTERAMLASHDDTKAFSYAMDSYEAYIDRYCDFMENYDVSNISMLTEYAKLMGQYADMTEKFEQWEDSDLNDTELAYYLQVQSNINQKLLAVTP